MGKKARIKKIIKIEKQTSVDVKPAEAKRTFRFVHSTYIHILLIIIIGLLSYANTFHAPFQWDEGYFIVDNPIVKDMGFFTEPSKARDLGNRYMHLKSRYVGYLTFALNYRMSGTHVAGYHIVNFAIHISSAILVYVLVLLIFRTPFLEQSILKRHSRYVALFSGLLFVSHPVQTEAVTYIFQRLASLGAFLYLLSITAYISSRLSTVTIRKYVFFTVSLISAILAMKTKENTFTLPFVIVLIEFAFFTGSVRSRIFRLIPFSLTLLIIPLTMIGIDRPLGEIITDIGPAAADTEALSRGDYFFTQMRVIPTYIRLLIFPVNQNLDYSYQIFNTLFTPQVFLSTGLIMSIIGLAVYLFHRSRFAMPELRVIAFGIFFFFIALSVESSIIPLNTIINEYRLYLPSVGFFISLVVGIFLFSERFKDKNVDTIAVVVLCIITLVFSYVTYSRNALWKSTIALWYDAAKKSPRNPRAHNNLGNAYMSKGFMDKAIEQYLIALEVQPDVAGTHNNLGYAYESKGLIDKAIDHYEISLKLDSDHPKRHNNLGNAYKSKGLMDKAIEQYQFALELEPYFADAHNNLGNAYKSKGLMDKAIEQYQFAVRLQPDHADMHFNLGLIFFQEGLIDDALKEFKIVLKLNPDDYEAKKYVENILSMKKTKSQTVLPGGNS